MFAGGNPIRGVSQAFDQVEEKFGLLYEAPLAFLPPEVWSDEGDVERHEDDTRIPISLLHRSNAGGHRSVPFVIREEVKPYLDRAALIKAEKGSGASHQGLEGKLRFGRGLFGRGGGTLAKSLADGGGAGQDISTPTATARHQELSGKGRDSNDHASDPQNVGLPHLTTAYGAVDGDSIIPGLVSPLLCSLDLQDVKETAMIGLALDNGDDDAVEHTGGRAAIQYTYVPRYPTSPVQSTKRTTIGAFSFQSESAGSSGSSSHPSDVLSNLELPSSPKRSDNRLDVILAVLKRRLDIDMGYLLQVRKPLSAGQPQLAAARRARAGGTAPGQTVELLASVGLTPRSNILDTVSSFSLRSSTPSSCSSTILSKSSGGSSSMSNTFIPQFDIGINLSSTTAENGLYYQNPTVFSKTAKKLLKQANKGALLNKTLAAFPSGDPVRRLNEAMHAGPEGDMIASGIILPVIEFETGHQVSAIILGLFVSDADKDWSLPDIEIAKTLVQKAIWTSDLF